METLLTILGWYVLGTIVCVLLAGIVGAIMLHKEDPDQSITIGEAYEEMFGMGEISGWFLLSWIAVVGLLVFLTVILLQDIKIYKGKE